jgi:hypothetical protein
MPGTRNNYANLKSQCGWKRAELINDHKMRVSAEGHRETIIEEVSATLKEKDAGQGNTVTINTEGRSEGGVGPIA